MTDVPRTHHSASRVAPDPGVDDTAASLSPPAKARPRHHWLLIAALSALIVPALLFSLWAFAALHYTYSAGSRAGTVQKFSQKGWLCKTWEGELAMANLPGALQERWSFSVRDDSVAATLNRSLGSKVALSYAQHKGVPTSCFADTEYYVTAVRVLAP